MMIVGAVVVFCSKYIFYYVLSLVLSVSVGINTVEIQNYTFSARHHLHDFGGRIVSALCLLY